MSITLHSKLGLNARLVENICPICAEKHHGSLILMGSKNYYDVCPQCGCKIYGGARDAKLRDNKCSKCGHVGGSGWERHNLSDWETVPGGVEVCQQCQAWMKDGIILISVKDDDKDYRTGGFAVVKAAAIERMISPPELAKDVLKRRVCFIGDSAWDKMGLPRGSTANKAESNEH